MQNKAVLKAAVGLLKAAYLPTRPLRIRNKITFISRQSSTPTTDIQLLSSYIGEKYPETECVVLTRKISNSAAGYFASIGYIFRQMYHIATSRVVALDGYNITACVLNHKKGTTIVQMWHSMAAIKQFGYQTIGKAAGHDRNVAEAMCMHRNYDVIFAPSKVTGGHFCKAFGYGEDVLRYFCLPRLDRFTGIDSGEAAEMKAEYGLDNGRENILYVPTFRSGTSVDLEGLIRAVDPERFNLVIKLHPLYREQYRNAEIPCGDLKIAIDEKYDSTKWVNVCDRIITDYSALGVEATVLGKPLYYYVYDIDEYMRNVGLNVNPEEEMPQCTAETSEQLKSLLEADYNYECLTGFRNRFIEAPTDNCTGRIGDFLHGITEKAH